MQREKPPEWREKQKGSRGIRRGQRYRLVFQFPIRELARLLENRVAALRDNDGNYQQNCDERYADVLCSRSRVFADHDNSRSTFEICLYQDNADLCDALFRGTRRTLTVQDYMLANKAEAAFQLLQLHAEKLTVPDYIQEALAWIRE